MPISLVKPLKPKQKEETVVMSKNSKNEKSTRGPGRPSYEPRFPKSKEFTFADFAEANGIDLKTGKGEQCTPLTLRKWLKRDQATKGHSVLVLVKGVTADPQGKKGLGRRALVYSLRDKASATSKPHTTKGSLSKATEKYEAQKAEIATPEATVAVPVLNVTPEAPAPTPEPPVASETPTPAPETSVPVAS